MKDAQRLGLDLQDVFSEIESIEVLLNDVSAKLTHVRDDVDKYQSNPQFFLWDNGREIRLLDEILVMLINRIHNVRSTGAVSSKQLIDKLRSEGA